MAITDNCRTARLMLVVALTTSLAACSFGDRKGVQLRDATPDNDLGERGGANQSEILGGYSAVVPRAFIPGSELSPDAPDTYTVVKGDTLWDISDRFLKKAWLWPDIWGYNPQIANPHLIFPGDTIALEYINGQPTMVLIRNGKRVNPFEMAEPQLGAANGPAAAGDGVRQRLSPRIRATSINDAVPTIPGEVIRQFLVHPKVVANDELADAPYILDTFDGHLMSAAGNEVYARGRFSRDITRFGVYRKGKPLVDPASGRTLGHEVNYVADARLLEIGDPSTLLITSSKQETMTGDLLLPNNDSGAEHMYTPRLPVFENGEGRIVSLVNAISQSGRNQVVVLNLGRKQSVQTGDVLAVESSGRKVTDKVSRKFYERVSLPNVRSGVVMVFKVFDEVSYALVMESERPIKVGDLITGL